MALTLIPGGSSAVQACSQATPRHPLAGLAVRQVGWVDYDNGYGRIFQSVRYPRLKLLGRVWAEDGFSRTFWIVDGETVLDADDALEALNVPPVLTEEESEILSRVPADWTKPSAMHTAITDGFPVEHHHARIQVLRSLAEKGQIEVEGDRIRRI